MAVREQLCYVRLAMRAGSVLVSMSVTLLGSCRERAEPHDAKSVTPTAASGPFVPSPRAPSPPESPSPAPSGAPAAPEGERASSSAPAPGAVLLERQKRHEEKPAKSPSVATGEKTCSIDAEYPAVRGIDPAVARRINAALMPNEAKLEPECEAATSYEVRYTVVLNEKGLLSVVFDGNWCCGAHPSYSKRFVNARTSDGKLLTAANLFRKGSARKIAAHLQARAKKELGDEVWNDWLAEQTAEARDFSLEPGGVRFSFFNAAPHVVQSAFEPGFLVPCHDLDALGLLPGALDAICARP